MSKSKKILSLALALVMALSIFSICSFAVSTNTATVTLEASAASVGNNETVTITVKASSAATFYAGPMSIPITYDNTLFTLVGTPAYVEIFGTGVTETITNTATAGKIILTVLPKTDGAPVAPDLSTEKVIATLTFTSDAAATGTGTFAIDNDQKTTANPTGKFYIGEFSTDDPKTATLETIVGTLTRVPVDVNVGVAEPELILTATGEANGVIIDTNKTFGGVYAGVVYGFPQAATNTFRTINYITTNLTTTTGALTTANLARTVGTAGYGTGTTITVGSKVYVIVIFGDVDGNGLINPQDTTALKGYVNSPATLAANSVIRMACNCQQVNNGTMLHTVNTQDTTALKAYVNNASNKFSPATLASYQNSKNNFYQ
jgi:hypothetical protein